MAMIYGTTSKLPGLDLNEIGYEPAKKKFSGLEIFRIIIDVAAIGASLIPGVDLALETGIALTAGTINETLDAVTGRASVIGTLLDLGTPFIAAGAVGRTSKNIVKLAGESFGTITSKLDELIELGISPSRAAAFSSITGKSIQESERILSASETISKIELTTFQTYNKGQRTIEESIIESTGGDFSRKDAQEILRILKRVNKEIPNSKTIQALKDERKIQQRILRVIGFTAQETNDVIRKMNSLHLSQEEKFSYILDFIRQDAHVIAWDRRKFRAFKTAWDKGEILLNQAYQIPLARQLTRLAGKNFPAERIVEEVEKDTETLVQKIWKTIKKPGSRKFNDEVVQPVQAIFDANDAGRAPIEFAYRQIKKVVRQIFEPLKKIKDVENIESAFVRSGGIVVDSTWHLGYKLIAKAPMPGGVNVIVISFQKQATNWKKPVVVSLTDKQLEQYILSPGHYYINHLAYSRGGRRKLGLTGLFGNAGVSTINLKGLESIGTQVLTFLPIGSIKNLFSILSNVVENTNDMKNHQWKDQWWTKFKSSFKRAGINRSFRLLDREIVGGAFARKYGSYVGIAVGKELQRFGTNFLAPIAKNASNGKPLLTGITKNALAQQFGLGAKANIRKLARIHKGSNSVILQTLSARRKISQVNRLPNAAVPKRPYKSIRFNK